MYIPICVFGCVHMCMCVFGAGRWAQLQPPALCLSVIGSSLYIDILVQGTHLLLKSFSQHQLSKLNPSLYMSGSIYRRAAEFFLKVKPQLADELGFLYALFPYKGAKHAPRESSWGGLSSMKG